MSFGPACERCGANSYEGSMDDRPVRCPFCGKYKRRGSREELVETIQKYERQLMTLRAKLETIVECEGIDAGVIYLSTDSPTHYDEELRCQVYDHEFFSPLGDALVELHAMTQIDG